MRHVLLIACLAAAVPSFAADTPAEKKAAWLVEATTNVVGYTDDHGLLIELKITNNTEAQQTLRVPRFWECFCDTPRLGFGGWDKELRPYLPIPAANPPADPEEKPTGGHPLPPPRLPGIPPAVGGSPAQSFTEVNLAPGASYTRSWNWRDLSKDDPPKDFTFRMGLVINGPIGDERVWSSPITFKYTKPSAVGRKGDRS